MKKFKYLDNRESAVLMVNYFSAKDNVIIVNDKASSGYLLSVTDVDEGGNLRILYTKHFVTSPLRKDKKKAKRIASIKAAEFDRMAMIQRRFNEDEKKSFENSVIH